MRTLALLALLAVAAVARAEEPRIAWYGTWERGLRVAKDTGRPILLVAAAPQCRGISGLW